jgi:hypothetical protein
MHVDFAKITHMTAKKISKKALKNAERTVKRSGALAI